MFRYRADIERFVERLPRPSLMLSLATLGVAWLGLLAYDLLLADYRTTAPSDYDFARRLVPVLGLVPMFLRIVNPMRIDDDRRAHQVYLRVTYVMLGAMLLLLLTEAVPYGYSITAMPESLWSLFYGRFVALLALVSMPLLAEGLSMLYRYRHVTEPSLLGLLFPAVVILTVVTVQVLGLPVDGLTDGMQGWIALLVGVVAFIRSIRPRWIINLRKRHKLILLALSTAGIIGAGLTLGLIDRTGGYGALTSLFPGLQIMGLLVTLALVVTHVCVFFNALFTLPTAEAIDRRNVEVASLANLARLLTRSFEPSELVNISLSIARDVTGSGVAWMWLDGFSTRRQARTDQPQLLLGTQPTISEDAAMQLMKSIERHAPSPSLGEINASAPGGGGRRVVVAERLDGSATALQNAIPLHSAAGTPLELGGRRLGTLYVAKSRSRAFDRDDMLILEAVADQIALALEQSNLIQQLMQRQLFEQEMVIARDVQQQLLPRVLPESPFYSIYGESIPASMVGGDYFDVVAFRDLTLGLIIADVSGKGASAALYMSMIKGIIQALAGRCESPRELLSRINVALHGSIDRRRFATMSCAQMVPEHRRMRVARAGHCPSLLLRSGVASYSRPKGIGLAIARPALFDANLEIEELEFSPGDYVVFISDGIAEAANPEGEELGFDRLLQIAETAAGRVAAAAEAAEQGLDGGIAEDSADAPTALAPAVAGCVNQAHALRNAMFEEISTFTRGQPPGDDSTIVIVHWR